MKNIWVEYTGRILKKNTSISKIVIVMAIMKTKYLVDIDINLFSVELYKLVT